MQKDDTETNLLEKKFNNIEENIDKIETMINILLVALDNDFNTPQIPDIIDYIVIIKNHLAEHKKLLKNFIQELNLPDGKAKLLLLRAINFEKKD